MGLSEAAPITHTVHMAPATQHRSQNKHYISPRDLLKIRVNYRMVTQKYKCNIITTVNGLNRGLSPMEMTDVYKWSAEKDLLSLCLFPLTSGICSDHNTQHLTWFVLCLYSNCFPVPRGCKGISRACPDGKLNEKQCGGALTLQRQLREDRWEAMFSERPVCILLTAQICACVCDKIRALSWGVMTGCAAYVRPHLFVI